MCKIIIVPTLLSGMIRQRLDIGPLLQKLGDASIWVISCTHSQDRYPSTYNTSIFQDIVTLLLKYSKY